MAPVVDQSQAEAGFPERSVVPPATAVQGEWHQQADALCANVAVPDTLQP